MRRKTTKLSSLADTPLIDKRPRRKASQLLDDAKEQAAVLRAKVAYTHLVNAANQLDAACSDLSAVIGASDMYRKIRNASEIARACYRELSGDEFSTDGNPWKLDHTPSRDELAIGHGLRHGCGGRP